MQNCVFFDEDQFEEVVWEMVWEALKEAQRMFQMWTSKQVTDIAPNTNLNRVKSIPALAQL